MITKKKEQPRNLVKKGDVWLVDFTMTFGKKKKRFRAFGGYTLRQAQETLHKLKAAKADERRAFESGNVRKEDLTFAEFYEQKFVPCTRIKKRPPREKTALGYDLCFSKLKPVFGDKLLLHITTEDIEDYINRRREDKVKKISGASLKTVDRKISDASINREITFLKQVFRLAYKRGYISVDPAAEIAKFEESPRWTILESDEVQRLLEAASPRLRPILELLVTTGMRKNEALRLRWAFPNYEQRAYKSERETRSVLDLKKALIYIPAELSKNHKVGIVNLSRRLVDMFKELPRVPSSDQVFSLREIKRAFENAKKKAKLPPRLRIHDLRHTAATQMIKAGINIAIVCQVLRHSDIRITMRYCHAGSEDKSRAVEKLSEIYSESRQKVDIPAPRPMMISPVSPERMLH
jgi:integrase